jgi:major membrane immunogen (membrane-anchored lipoprotein)
MKKLYSTIMMVAMMVAALSLTACGSDDDDDNSTLIVGVWECTSANYGSMGSAVRNNLMEGDILTINSDMTYSIKGNRNSSGRCSIDNNELTISGYKYKINNLSSTTLSLSISLMGRTFSWSFRRK